MHLLAKFVYTKKLVDFIFRKDFGNTMQIVSSNFYANFARKYFLDAFTGMGSGLFVALIAGLIFCQIARWTDLAFLTIGTLAQSLM